MKELMNPTKNSTQFYSSTENIWPVVGFLYIAFSAFKRPINDLTINFLPPYRLAVDPLHFGLNRLTVAFWFVYFGHAKVKETD